MGMLTINEDCIKRKKNFLTTYKLTKQDENMAPYIFGCNYSNPTYVCNYLIRLFPFTQICIEIQGTGFDTPRRLFTSIEKSFKNAISASTDVREIIPEFFYFPEIFLNINYLNMGKLDKDNIVSDVVTPCRNNPFEFIYTMKNVLENEKVSYNINNWIDLIFGYKAKGKEAENAKNLFTEQSYQEDININMIEDKDSYLRYGEFGLIPNQLFNIKEFPKKEKLDDVKKFKQITEYSFKLKKYRCKRSNYSVKYTEDLLLLSVNSTSQDKLLLLYNSNFFIEERISYSIFDKEYSEEILGKKLIPQTLNKMSNYFLPNNHKNKNIKIICGGKIIVMGGYYDAKVTVSIFDTENNSNAIIREIIPFKDESFITTLNIDKDEEYLFIGNSFGNIRIIRIIYNNQNNVKDFIMMNLITDQLSSISYIDINNTLNIWASASSDGYVNIYTMPLFKLTRSFRVSFNSAVNYIYLCDSPLPSIIIIGQEEIYLYSINGFKIYYQKEYSNIINPIVIKDFIGNDYLAYILNNKEIVIRNICDFSIQMRSDTDSEIYYLHPSLDMKMLYALNKSGTQIDLFMCDTKKTLEENQ
jgi:WD40 repeat protein